MTLYKVLIAGAGGMLATAVESALSPVCRVTALTKVQLDITHKDAVFKAIDSIKPDVIVNTAAFTNADECEKKEEEAISTNGTAVGYLAQAAQLAGAKIIHISTDYVFDGEKEGQYAEEDKPNPISVYGQSKLVGEQELVRFTDNFIIIRTQWMFGEKRSNFVDTIIKLAREKDELKVVDDQYGSPTYTKDVAEIIKWFIEHNNVKGQVFNFSNEGIVSRFGFAREILKLAGIKTRLIPVATSAFPRPAKRPHNSALDKTKIKQVTGMGIRPWHDALYEYMKNTGKI
jgi:dTDP-4-dehydrorhamnose reductase